MSIPAVSIPKVEVFPGRLRLFVSMADDAPRFTDEALMNRAFAEYPTLGMHSCINSKGPTFGDVAVGTSIPHLLEHLIIAEQVIDANSKGTAADDPSIASARINEGNGDSRGHAKEATFVGTTKWDDGGAEAGHAVVEVSFIDDLQALAALKRALSFLNRALYEGDAF